MKYEDYNGKTLFLSGPAAIRVESQRPLPSTEVTGQVERFGRLTVSPSGAAKLEPISPDQLWFISIKEDDLKKIVVNKGQRAFTYNSQEVVPDLFSLS